MKKLLLAIIASLVLLGTAHAQLPNTPSATVEAKTPTLFWIATGAYVGSIVFDGETTFPGLKPGVCYESGGAWLYGNFPSRLRFYGTNAAIALPTVLVSRHLVRSQSRLVRGIGWALLDGQTSAHSYAGIRNLGVSCR